ncbi:alpha 1,2 mannosyltransferase [Coemansia sp. RSA 485]|nr:alpha 1,2 mannosyltransferase [Coemansia sp. RSA 485]
MRRRSAAVIYGVLLALRVLLAAQPAYIHPDEFLQMPEIAAGDLLSLDVMRTWEFVTAQPIRSILPIYVFSGPPLLLLRLLRDYIGIPLSATNLFMATRGFTALLSLLVDYNVYCALRRSNKGAAGLRPTMFLLASSYCLCVFHTRSFANTYASVVLAICFNLLSDIEARKTDKVSWSRYKTIVMLGGLLAFGCFVHISFAMFALPIGITAILLIGFSDTPWLILGGLCTATLAITSDYLYYGKPVLTILNNLRYNSSTSNLALHGTHPRYLHLLVSMPTLFGPLLFLAIGQLWTTIKNRRNQTHTSLLGRCAAASVFCGLGFLSLAPHQEPRFMVPALSPLAIASWRWHRVAPRYFWWLWAIFNLILAIAYGVVHQAGVLPTTIHISKTSVFPSPICHPIQQPSPDVFCKQQQQQKDALESTTNWTEANVTTNVFFYASFPMPRHLLTQPKLRTTDHGFSRVRVTDLVMMSDIEVRNKLDAQPLVQCSSISDNLSLVFTQTGNSFYERSLLAVPATADLSRIKPSGSLTLIPVFTYSPHVNFDHIAELLQNPISRSSFYLYLMCQR